MDEERIGLVLAKTSELRSKIINCIHETAPNLERESGNSESKESGASPDAESQNYDGEEEEEEEAEAEAETLLNIKDALESLEGQLSSLQALQQQQWYENEAALSEIKYSQKKLLKELKQYKGKDLQVIHEAISFATLATDDNHDLLLPPYPSRPPHPIVPENGVFSTTRKLTQNGDSKNPDNGPGGDQRPNGLWGPLGSVGGMIKTALAIAGVVGVLSLVGFKPHMRKRDNGFVKMLGLFRVNGEKGRGGSGGAECPPGKVALMENGEMRCVVKERVEVPFESAVATPDVSYGFG